MRRPIQLSLDEHFVDQVDAARGSIPRSRYIEDIVKAEAALPAIPTREPQAQMDAEDVSTNPPISEEVRRGTPQSQRSPKPPAERQARIEKARKVIDEPKAETELPKIARRHWAG